MTEKIQSVHSEISCTDLDTEINYHVNELGFRLDMIAPADSPTTAILSKDGIAIRLLVKQNKKPNEPNQTIARPTNDLIVSRMSDDAWVSGRAGMAYRDLIPGRMNGRLVASHIRILNGGPVPDYVHYHKVDFQMIYCYRGQLTVVYEDQGPPFVLNAGDCVLQPPEIRHRVLEATAGAEVIEIGMPAIHETWVEHHIPLPTSDLKPDRDFGGQRFVRHVANNSVWKMFGSDGVYVRDTGIADATNGLAHVCVLRMTADEDLSVNKHRILFYFVLTGEILMNIENERSQKFFANDSFLIPDWMKGSIKAVTETEILTVAI